MEPINYFEYVDDEYQSSPTHEYIEQVARGLYEQISEFYMFLIESIEPEDYERMQTHLGYTESYDEHINSLTEGVPQRETTISQIVDFLNKYREFIDDEYITVLKQLNSRIQMNKELCKMQAYQILQQQREHQQHRQLQRDSQPEHQHQHFQIETDNSKQTQPKVEALIGGKIMSFDTYNNPLLVSLYSLLLVWFSLKHYNEPPKPVVYH